MHVKIVIAVYNIVKIQYFFYFFHYFYEAQCRLKQMQGEKKERKKTLSTCHVIEKHDHKLFAKLQVCHTEKNENSFDRGCDLEKYV